MRARTTCAMLCQLAALDTLVPPNLSTSQAWLPSGREEDMRIKVPRGPTQSRLIDSLIVFEYFAQFFFQLALG